MFDERKHLRKKCVIYKNGDEKCSICLSYLNCTPRTKVVAQLPCGHMFHPKCIKQWSRPTCPLCRHCFFFQHYHTIDRWNGKKYRPRNHLALNTYPYNNRYKKSYGNLVLFELRRFQRYYKRSSFRAARASAKSTRWTRGIGVFNGDIAGPLHCTSLISWRFPFTACFRQRRQEPVHKAAVRILGA